MGLALVCITCLCAHANHDSAETEADPWYSYAEDENFIYEHDFMTSRDGQGFHWWIYLEAAYIMRAPYIATSKKLAIMGNGRFSRYSDAPRSGIIW